MVSGSEEGATKLGSSQGSGWGSRAPAPKMGSSSPASRGEAQLLVEREQEGDRDSSCGPGPVTPWTAEQEQAPGSCIVLPLVPVLTAGHKGLIGVEEPAPDILGRGSLDPSSVGAISTRLSPHQEVATT